ncbi:MAG: hypothetical protein QM796_18415 [Chthoniobacteraceae bacterium]
MILADLLSTLPPDFKTFVILGAMVTAVSMLANLTLVFLQIWQALRPRSDLWASRAEVARIDGELHELEIRLTNQLVENRASMDSQIGKLGEKMDNFAKSMQALAKDIYIAIGRQEGRE